MPARIALGHIAAWEPPLDAALMALAIYLTARIASRVYAGGLIRSGARLSWRQAMR
jgi:ABC-2 type transport system permease protein